MMYEKSFWLRRFEAFSFETREARLATVKQNGLAIKYFKDADEEICLVAINADPLAIKYITNRTPTIMMALCHRLQTLSQEEVRAFLDQANLAEDHLKLALDALLPQNLHLIPYANLSESILEYLAGKWPILLSWYSKPSERMIKAAQASCPITLENLSEEAKLQVSKKYPYMTPLLELTEDSVRQIIKEDSYTDYHITEYCDRRFKYLAHMNPDLLHELILRNSFYFKDVARFQTPETALLAVQERCYNLRYAEPQTEEMCWTALKSGNYCIEFIKNPTYGMVSYYLAQELRLYSHIRHLLTEKEWLMFYEKDPSYIHYFPSNLRTPELCDRALDANGYAIKYIENPTDEQIKRALTRDPCALQYVKDSSYCEYAVSLDGRALAYVSEKTDALCKMAVTNDGIAIKYVPKQTLELCLLAASQTPRAFEWINAEYLFDCYQATDRLTQRIVMNKAYYYGIQMPESMLLKCQRLSAKKETIRRETGLLIL